MKKLLGIEMDFSLRDSICDELVLLIYGKGGNLFQLRSADTYAPLADKFKIEAEARKIIQDEIYKNGRAEPVWNNMVQWARQDLVDEGYLDAHAPHGIWRLTPKGIAHAQGLLRLREKVRVSLEQFRREIQSRSQGTKAADTGPQDHS